jgi:protein-disulfide isomerase
VLVPVLCLAATAAFWWQTRTELATMRADQREILDVVRGVSSLDIAGAPAVGPDDAVVTLVEFSDYECPFCIRHFALTMPEIMEKYIEPGRIRYVFRDFPIAQLHPEAIRGHEAAKCAAEEGLFWQMHGRMFSPAGSHTMEQLEAHATAIGVPLDRFRECMASGRHTEAIRASIETASRLGASGTPSFFVGLRDPDTEQVRLVQAISGAQPFSEFEKALDAAFAQAAER